MKTPVAYHLMAVGFPDGQTDGQLDNIDNINHTGTYQTGELGSRIAAPPGPRVFGKGSVILAFL